MTDAELTILSLVAEAPRYGYEIQQLVDERGLREWLTIGFSSIYYILNRLERQKMVSSRLHTHGGPARKIYEITDSGRGILQTAVADLLRQPRSVGSGFELGLANLRALKPQQVNQVLKHHREDLQKRLEAVEKAWQKHQAEDTDAEHIQALYTHSLAVMRAELEWLTNFLSSWRARYPSVEDQPEGQALVPGEAAPTQIHHPTHNNDPAKMIQRLKRLPSTKE